MIPSVYVFRTSGPEREWIWIEIGDGRLRQGWGCRGSELLRDGRAVERDEWIKSFVPGAKEAWGTDESEQAEKRHKILSLMTQIVDGDLLIVPKMPEHGSFIVARATGEYSFDKQFKNSERPDYGHVIPIDSRSVRQYSNRASVTARSIVKRLSGYQCAVNRVLNNDMISAAISLAAGESNTTDRSSKELLDRVREEAVLQFLKGLHQTTPRDLEDAVCHAFVQCGFDVVVRNKYDRLGGDADLVLSRSIPILGDIAAVDVTVFVQVKHKVGVAQDDVKGVRQLSKITLGQAQCVKVLISTADDFTEECRALASEEGVLLISGRDLAEVLLRNE